MRACAPSSAASARSVAFSRVGTTACEVPRGPRTRARGRPSASRASPRALLRGEALALDAREELARGRLADLGEMHRMSRGLAHRDRRAEATTDRERERDAVGGAQRRGDALEVAERRELLEAQARLLLRLAVEVEGLEEEIAGVPPPRAPRRERRRLVGGEQREAIERDAAA